MTLTRRGRVVGWILLLTIAFLIGMSTGDWAWIPV